MFTWFGSLIRSWHTASSGPYACDNVIVGAGSAGSVVAARLSEDPHRRVLLIEAGGEATGIEAIRNPRLWLTNIKTEVDWRYDTELQRGTASTHCRVGRSWEDPARSMQPHSCAPT